MRAVFINHCHPGTPHVCATRMREFASAMATRGHHIILFTETLENEAPTTEADQIAEVIKKHNFTKPLYLASRPIGHKLITRLRNKSLPWGIRQLVIFWFYFKHNGVFTDWREGSRAFLKPIAKDFKPDLIWSTFGNTDCWNIAKDLSETAGCPWIGDTKDPWKFFIPGLFRKYLSQKYRSNAALTTFSKFHSNDTKRWFKSEPTIIYSGYPEKYLAARPPIEGDAITISLTGAVYSELHLSELLKGFLEWFSKLTIAQKSKIHFVYAGNDTAMVQSATAKLSEVCDVSIKDYLPLEELHLLHQKSHANLYIKSNRTFHHKSIEMLSAGKPLICFPGEIDEVKNIAEQTNIPLHSCSSTDDIIGALNQCLHQEKSDEWNETAIKKLSWESQAEKLECVFQRVLSQIGKRPNV